MASVRKTFLWLRQPDIKLTQLFQRALLFFYVLLITGKENHAPRMYAIFQLDRGYYERALSRTERCSSSALWWISISLTSHVRILVRDLTFNKRQVQLRLDNRRLWAWEICCTCWHLNDMVPSQIMISRFISSWAVTCPFPNHLSRFLLSNFRTSLSRSAQQA